VEIYRNGSLMDFTTVDEEGHFRFAAVPLTQGANVLRIVLYGPQGQEREEVRTLQLGSQLLPPGRLDYDLSLLQPDTGLFPTESSASRGESAWKGVGEFRYGWKRNLTLLLGLAGGTGQNPSGAPSSADKLFSLGSAFGTGPMLWRARLALDEHRGKGFWAASHGRLGPLSFRAEQGFRTLESALVLTDAPGLTRLTNLQISGRVKALGGRPLAFDLQYRGESFGGGAGRGNRHLKSRLSGSAGPVYLSQISHYHQFHGDEMADSHKLGMDWLASIRLGRLQVRNQLRTDIHPEPGLVSLNTNLNWRPQPRMNVQAGLSSSLAGDPDPAFNGSLTWLQSKANLGLNITLNQGRSPTLNLTISCGLARNPEGGGWTVSGQRLAQGATVQAQVFLDKNADGQQDPGEPGLPGVRFRGASHWDGIRTGPQGYAFLPGVPANRPFRLELDTESLLDPFLVPLTESLYIQGHPGGTISTSFAVQMTGEAEGHVHLRHQDQDFPAAGLTMELLGIDGEVLDSTVSQFDGFYLFQRIPPGHYQIRIAVDDLERRDWQPVEPLLLEIGPDGGVVGKLDFRLQTGP
jgi:hypothetical protein